MSAQKIEIYHTCFNDSGRDKYSMSMLFIFSHYIYDFVKPLSLVPFNVRQKQVPTIENSQRVSSIFYVEINAFEAQIKLLKGGRFIINGIKRSSPFNGLNNTYITHTSGKTIVSMSFGLNVTWDGSNKASYSLSYRYAAHVCGLCGNADGKNTKKSHEINFVHLSLSSMRGVSALSKCRNIKVKEQKWG